jgi:hypothetical protein
MIFALIFVFQIGGVFGEQVLFAQEENKNPSVRIRAKRGKQRRSSADLTVL